MPGDNEWPTGGIIFKVIACVSAGDLTLDATSAVVNASLAPWSVSGVVGDLLVDGMVAADLEYDSSSLDLCASGTPAVAVGDTVVLDWTGTDQSQFVVPVGDVGRVFEHYTLPTAGVLDSYPIAHGPVIGSIKVVINGSIDTSWSYNATDKTVDFSIPPASGATMEISYNIVGGCQ